MNRKIAAGIAALCIIAVLGAAGSIAYRVISGGEAGREAAAADFSVLLSTASAARSASDLGSQELRGELAARFSSSPSLLAAEIYQGGSTIWRMPAESPYPLGASADSARLPASALRLSAPLGFGTPGAAMLDAVYVRVSQLSVFTAFRDALVFLAGFLALASMAAAIASRPRRRGPEYAPAAGPSLGEEEEEAEAERPRRKARPKKRQAKTAQREIEELFAVEDESPASSAAASSFGAASSSGAAARGPEPKPAYEPIEEAEELDAEPLWDAEPSWAAEPASTAAPAAAPSSSAKEIGRASCRERV